MLVLSADYRITSGYCIDVSIYSVHSESSVPPQLTDLQIPNRVDNVACRRIAMFVYLIENISSHILRVMMKVTTFRGILSSINLAIITLSCLAVTSILGTFIPQKETAEFYTGKYGVTASQLIKVFDIQDMYHSWWFLALLSLLCVNLIFCTLERFPKVLKLINSDNLNVPVERISKMGCTFSYFSTLDIKDTVQLLSDDLVAKGWKPKITEREDNTLIFCQKGAFSRLGVYIVHTSVLIIFIGAIIGHVFGFKGSIMLPEQRTSSKIFPFTPGDPIELGFGIRCDRFDIEFYPNGMPKEYRSELAIVENGKEVLTKTIEVNDPLVYKGITFYQASYQSYRDFSIVIKDEKGIAKSFSAPYRKELLWNEKGLRFGIINLESFGDRVTRLKIWFSNGAGKPSVFWLNSGEQMKITRAEATYFFSAKQRCGTGLQVVKDPGIWLVYLGFSLMLIGLYMAFFMSHKRIRVLVKKEENRTKVLMGGSASKNRDAFAAYFDTIANEMCIKN